MKATITLETSSGIFEFRTREVSPEDRRIVADIFFNGDHCTDVTAQNMKDTPPSIIDVATIFNDALLELHERNQAEKARAEHLH